MRDVRQKNMPWLPLYATEDDFREVFRRLSDDADVAYLVSNGTKKWIAVNELEYAEDRRYCLWHIPGGPLPLISHTGKDDGVIDDPWSGWTEDRTGADPTVPYFGSGDARIIWLNARAKSLRVSGGIGLSSFEWIGNHFRIIGRSAPTETEKYWKRLGSSVRKGATRIPREGPIDGPRPEIWALPKALQAIANGTERDNNP